LKFKSTRFAGAAGSRPALGLAALAAASLLAGCAGYGAYSKGKSSLEAGDTVAGVEHLREAMSASPGNLEYRQAYFANRERGLGEALRELELALDAGEFARASAAAAKAQQLDATNPRTAQAQDRIAAARRHWGLLDKAQQQVLDGKPDLALSGVQQVLSENPIHRRALLMQRQLQRSQADAAGKELGLYPKLREAFRKPVTLSLVNASLLQVFDALKVSAGLNFMFDREVRQDQRVTLSVANKSVDDVLRLLLATHQLEKRVLDEDTVFIYPNTPQKSREYQELVVRSFYLSNADIGKAANLVRSIARARDVFVDEKLNLLVVRDTAEVVRLSEKLIANQDLADPEVVLDLEVMEVSTSRLTELGIRWPDSVSASVQGASGTPGTLTLPEFRGRDSSLVRLQFNDPLIAAQLRAQRGDSALLANPRIRVRNRQTAKILIGERVPVITTTATAGVGSSESVNYLDVGLKLEVEPTVSLDDDVAMKVALEVSNVIETIKRTSGTQFYRVGTRNASTQLRVRDGETQVLAGLIRREELKSNTGIPLLNDVPGVNKLFGQGSGSNANTEIVLLITPRVVRNISMPGPGQIEFLSGTEAANGAAPMQLSPGREGAQPLQPQRWAEPPPPVAPVPATPYVPAPVPANPPPAFTPPPLVPQSAPTAPPKPGSFP
jgi:general secretion pathway protein D